MLSSVLKTNIVADMSIKIIMDFYTWENNKNNILVNHEERILKLEESFDKFSSKEKTIIRAHKLMWFKTYLLYITYYLDYL